MKNPLFWGEQPLYPSTGRFEDKYLGDVINNKLWIVGTPVGLYTSKSGKRQFKEDRIGINFLQGLAKDNWLLFSGVSNHTQLLTFYSENDADALSAQQKWIDDGMLMAIDTSSHKQLSFIAKILGERFSHRYMEILTDNTLEVPEKCAALFNTFLENPESEQALDAALQLSDYSLVIELFDSNKSDLAIKRLERSQSIKFQPLSVEMFTPPAMSGGKSKSRTNFIQERATYVGSFLDTVPGDTLEEKMQKILSDKVLLTLYAHHLTIATGSNCFTGLHPTAITEF